MTIEDRRAALVRLAKRALEEIRSHDPRSRMAHEIDHEYEAVMLAIADLPKEAPTP